jgi:flagellar motility protein MotE (MotC chaperone)
MRPAPATHRRIVATGVRAASLGVLGVSVLAAIFASPAFAQQGWETVVAVAGAVPPNRATTAKRAPSPAMEAFIVPLQLAAQQPKPVTVDPAATLPRAPKPAEPPPLQTSAARQYCVNIANAAADARFAWQKKTLADTEQELEKRIALLEEKTAEFQKWVTRRDEFVKKARENLVLIYSRMRPDAAAMQLTAMDEETASAVLLKLDPRIASLILNEMEPAQAARLTAIISGAARGAPAGGPRSGPEEKKS